MKVICISDTHCQLEKVSIPDGDILVHSGDLTYSGNIKEISKELFELSKHRGRFKEIVLVEGNHDWLGFHNPTYMDEMCKDNGITLLRDSGKIIDGVNFYGVPWQPEFRNWAFNLPRGKALKEKWDLIPDDTNVLITHGPPMGIMDGVEKFNCQKGEIEIEHVGCVDLYNKAIQLKELKIHVFGHLHFGYGTQKLGNTTFINASTCTEQYRPTNSPIIISI
jgi:Icc-related predicted phosphoesterase